MNLRTVLLVFLHGLIPSSLLAQGEFWGTARGTEEGLFKTDGAGKNLQIMHKFSFTNPGEITNGQQLRLLEASNGLFYGITTQGGKYDKGLIFQYSEDSNTYRALHHFNDTLGGNPTGTLIQASNGKIYGTTQNGGTSNGGVIFEYNIDSQTYKVLWKFVTSTGYDPSALRMVEATTGKLYGTTSNGGTNNNGVVFVYDISAGTYSKLADFTSTTDYRARCVLLEFRSDTLYGTTNADAASNDGSIFLFDIKNSKITKLYDLTHSNGATPTGELYLHNNTTIIGVCQSGGANIMGTIFEYNIATKTFQKAYDHSNKFGGVYPLGGLVQMAPGKLLGIFQEGYAYIYDIATKKIFFQGNGPYTGTPTISSKTGRALAHCAGEGTGSGYVDGSLAEIDTLNNKRVWLIQMNIKDGKTPNSELLFVDSNRIFGTTFSGGYNNAGLMFEYYRNTGTYRVVWHNADTVPIVNPIGNLIQAKRNNKIYGFCNTQGIIELDPNTYEKHKYSDGMGDNNAGIFQTPDSNVYLMSESGTILKLDLAQRKTSTYIFVAATAGNSTYFGPLTPDKNGLYYGTNFNGGADKFGCIFSVNMQTKAVKVVYDFDGTTMKNPASDLQIRDSFAYGRLLNGNVFEYNLNSGKITSHSFGSGADLLLGSNRNVYASVNNVGVKELNTRTFTSKTTAAWPTDYTFGSQSRMTEICFTPAAGPITGNSIVCSDSSIQEFSVPAMDDSVRFHWELPKGAHFADTDTLSRKVKVFFSRYADTGKIVVTPVNQCAGKSSSITVMPSPSVVLWSIDLFLQPLVIGKTILIETRNINPICHKEMQFSHDSGKTYTTIKTNLDYEDSAIVWTIPDTESEHCFLRVVGLNAGKSWTSPKIEIASPLPYKGIDFLSEFTTVAPNAQNPENAVQPGYYVRFKAQIQNEQSYNLLTLKGILQSRDTNIIITDSIGAFNNILAGKKGWSADEFEIFIKPNCPANYLLQMDLQITDGTDTEDPWTSRSKIQFPIRVFQISSVGIDDDNIPDSKGDNDDVAESGEVIEVLPLLQNTSQWEYNKTSAKLTSPDKFVRIWNDTNGSSGKVYHSWRYNAPGGNHQPVTALANNVAPEQDYVMSYQAQGTYAMDFRMLVDCYLTDFKVEDPVNSNAREPKIRYGTLFQMNKGYSKTISALFTAPQNGSTHNPNSTIAVTANIASTNALDSVNFYINDTLKLSNKQNSLTYNWNTAGFPAGVYVLKLKAKDVNGNNASDMISVYLGVPNTIDNKVIPQFAIFPNPNNGNYFVKLNAAALPATLVVCNMAGQELQRLQVVDEITECHMDNLPAGVYAVRLLQPDQTTTAQKLLIQR